MNKKTRLGFHYRYCKPLISHFFLAAAAVAGVLGMFLGMLAGQLGNVFQVHNSVSGSIMGPMQGIFVAGICVPWVNAKVTGLFFLKPPISLKLEPECTSRHYLSFDEVQGRPVRGAGKGIIVAPVEAHHHRRPCRPPGTHLC